jgi:hypothetical protein
MNDPKSQNYAENMNSLALYRNCLSNAAWNTVKRREKKRKRRKPAEIISALVILSHGSFFCAFRVISVKEQIPKLWSYSTPRKIKIQFPYDNS